MNEYYILAIIVLFIAAYIYSYYWYPPTVSILQTRPYEFKPDMLLERQPIVIENNASSLDELHSAFFKVNPTEEFKLAGSDTWHPNPYKYVAVQMQTDGEILLCPASTRMIPDTAPTTTPVSEDAMIPDPDDSNLLAIQARTGEIIMIPFHWHYLITGKVKVKCLGIHDYVTYFLP
jgi:hypothetical protein